MTDRSSTTAKPSNEALRKAGAKHAKKVVDKLSTNSALTEHISDFPSFTMDELRMGKILGKGGFGTVNEILGFTVARRKHNRSVRNIIKSRSSIDDDAVAEDGYENRLFIAKHCIRSSGDARYAVKYLSPSVIQDPGLYIQGLIDMAVETRFLSAIEHTNIVKMRATSSELYSEKYFIVMDRLYDTLEKRLKKWESQKHRFGGVMGHLTDRSGAKTKALLIERLLYAYDLTDALEYLHKRNIIYRDLKPENVGFDIRDDIKIFDFGLSKEITPGLEEVGDDTYRLTEETGTPRYMAPEVALGEPYNAKCDVYSMSVLLWEMLALKQAYENYLGMKAKKQKVHRGGKRPPLDHQHWSNEICLLLTRGWDRDLKSRHSMESFSLSLRTYVVKLRDGDESGMDHLRRRSTFVFRENGDEPESSRE